MQKERTIFSEERTPGEALPLFIKSTPDEIVKTYSIITEFKGNFSLIEPHMQVKNLRGHQIRCTFMEPLVGYKPLSKLQINHTDKRCKSITIQILQALAYLHFQKIIHRDVSSNNVLYKESSCRIKIIDFGFSEENISLKMRTSVGTVGHAAPEIGLEQKSNEKADVWSAGAVIFRLSEGEVPYGHNMINAWNSVQAFQKGDYNSYIQFYNSIHTDQISINTPFWDLINQLLAFNHKKRPSALKALTHSYVN